MTRDDFMVPLLEPLSERSARPLPPRIVPSAPQPEEAWSRRGPRRGARPHCLAREPTQFGRGCAARTLRNNSISKMVEAAGIEPGQFDDVGGHCGGVSQKSAIRRARWVARVRYLAWRTAIPRAAWTNGTMPVLRRPHQPQCGTTNAIGASAAVTAHSDLASCECRRTKQEREQPVQSPAVLKSGRALRTSSGRSAAYPEARPVRRAGWASPRPPWSACCSPGGETARRDGG